LWFVNLDFYCTPTVLCIFLSQYEKKRRNPAAVAITGELEAANPQLLAQHNITALGNATAS
jgi:hypothetical protein